MDLLIAQATKNDVPEILDELQEFSKFFGTKISLFGDYEESKKIIENFVENHVFLIATKASGELIGFISGMIMPHIYNPTISTLVESFWWVKEKHRGSKAGLKLLEEFIAFGRDNVDWVIMTLESDSPVKETTLTRRGFNLKEKSYLLEVT